ncbi:MAG: leucine-rich repeat domain-containing protein [Pseudomonadota bacterium]|nr:leucine-rich repeat domain-containing protein [Pseudomonadota bacterium]
MSVWTVPNGIREITEQYVRDNMPAGTTEVVIPESVKNICSWAFNDCESLQSVVISEGVRNIGECAFRDCTSLESVVIPKSVISIDTGAFFGSKSLKSVVISKGVKSIGEAAFLRCESLQSVVISEGVKRVGGYAYSECTSLEFVIIPNSVESIGESAFLYCTALNLIVLPDVLANNVYNPSYCDCGITTNQTVIKYSDFNDWKCKNGLEGKFYSDQAILFLYQLQNDEDFRPTWNETLNQFPEVAVNDLLKFSGNKQMCLPEYFWSNGSRDVEVKMADAEQRNHCFKDFIQGNDLPSLSDGLLQNLSLSDSASFFCTAKVKHFRSHQSGEGLDRNSETLGIKG